MSSIGNTMELFVHVIQQDKDDFVVQNCLESAQGTVDTIGSASLSEQLVAGFAMGLHAIFSRKAPCQAHLEDAEEEEAAPEEEEEGTEEGDVRGGWAVSV